MLTLSRPSLSRISRHFHHFMSPVLVEALGFKTNCTPFMLGLQPPGYISAFKNLVKLNFEHFINHEMNISHLGLHGIMMDSIEKEVFFGMRVADVQHDELNVTPFLKTQFSNFSSPSSLETQPPPPPPPLLPSINEEHKILLPMLDVKEEGDDFKTNLLKCAHFSDLVDFDSPLNEKKAKLTSASASASASSLSSSPIPQKIIQVNVDKIKTLEGVDARNFVQHQSQQGKIAEGKMYREELKHNQLINFPSRSTSTTIVDSVSPNQVALKHNSVYFSCTEQEFTLFNLNLTSNKNDYHSSTSYDIKIPDRTPDTPFSCGSSQSSSSSSTFVSPTKNMKSNASTAMFCEGVKSFQKNNFIVYLENKIPHLVLNQVGLYGLLCEYDSPGVCAFETSSSSSSASPSTSQHNDSNSKNGKRTQTTTLPTPRRHPRCRYHQPGMCGYQDELLNTENPLEYYNVFMTMTEWESHVNSPSKRKASLHSCKEKGWRGSHNVVMQLNAVSVLFIETLTLEKLELIEAKMGDNISDLKLILPFLDDMLNRRPTISYLKLVDRPKNLKKYVRKIYPVELPKDMRSKLPHDVKYGVKLPNISPLYLKSNTVEVLHVKGVISKPGYQQHNLFASNLAG